MHRSSLQVRGSALLGSLLSLGMVISGLGAAAQVAAPAPQVATSADQTGLPEPVGPSTQITLLTGDTVRLTEVGEGRRTVSLEPGPGREEVSVHQVEIDEELYLLPLDVLPYVAQGVLDRDLFNIDLLLQAGYDDASVDTLPVIASYADTAGSAAHSALSSVTGAEIGAELESISAQAVGVDKDRAGDFWAALTGVRPEEASAFATSGADADYIAAVDRLWLDAPVRPDLHESTRQIGAPTAWEAGIDGTGVRIAVLDTGVDAEHPDLAGQVALAEDFSGSGNVSDHVGHGTHVAATAAGTGAGSDGLRTGVAPGATILSGKVLGDDGNGALSGVIDGMEWAVAHEADVVNMSLGSSGGDGTGPLDQALNTLSEQTDTLFVVSAGNDGPGVATLGSPGTADAALTVGAVDRDESLAEFSSRGPRLGDLAVKPDLTAPGVGIVAARAAGTSMGQVVDEWYTAADGTSMAAPHVAGAAALLAAQHPDWDGDQLKDALISTAATHPELTPYEQGGGRVDVARAVTQEVTATGSVHLGTFHDEDTEAQTHQVSYRNTGDQEVTLDLELAVTDRAGTTPVQGGLTLSSETVTIPAGQRATVSVTVDPTVLDRGQYTGFLRARTGDTAVHTTLAVVKVAPTHEVTFTGVGFDGESIAVSPLVLLGEDPRFDSLSFIKAGQSTTFTVGEGSYFLHAMMTPEVDDLNASVVHTDPELEVTDDLEVVLDARDATQVQIQTPEVTTTRGNLGFITHREFAGRSLANSTMKFDDTQSVWVTPTEEPQEGTFEFSSRWQLGTPVLTGRTLGRNQLVVYPRYERYSPQLESIRPLELVDAGAGTREDYQGLDVDGKIAVVSLAEKNQLDVDAATAAGAAGLMVAPQKQWWTKYTGRGDRLDIPVVVLTPTRGQQLMERLSQRPPVRMRFEGDPDRPVTYDVMQVSSGAIPEEVVHTVSRQNSATVTARYHETGGEEWAKEQRFAWRPWQRSTIVETQQELHTPQQRTEIISGGDTLWRQHVLDHFSWDSMNPITGGASHPIRSYQPGEQVRYDWHRAVVRPAVVDASAPVRTGDTLSVHIPELVMGEGTLTQRSSPADTSMTLSQDGQVLAEGQAAWGDYPVGDGRVQLDLTVDRQDNPNWDTATRTHTSWAFDSTRPGADGAVQPLLSIDYDVPVALDNTVPAGSLRGITLTVSHPEQLADPARVRWATVWASYDDGQSWHRVVALPSGGSRGEAEFTALLWHPRGGEHVSLRVKASDRDGNSIEQTVLRAYALRSR